MHVPQLEDSCQSAAQALRVGAEKGAGPGDAAPQEEEPFAELPCCPFRPCLPTSGPNWEGVDRG